MTSDSGRPLMRFSCMPAATVANMEDDHCIGLNGEEHPVRMRLASIEKLTHLERKLLVLRRERAALGKYSKRSHRFFEFLESSQPGVARLLRKQPFQNAV
jgi:hypothetical protein